MPDALPTITPDQVRKAVTRQQEQEKAALQFAAVMRQVDTRSRHHAGVMHSLQMCAMHHRNAASHLRSLAVDMEVNADAD